MTQHAKYCPFCQHDIEPCNVEEYESGEHDSLIYVHDAVVHDEDYDFGEIH